MVHHFQYREGRLYAEDVDVTALAATVGTPFYVYSAATLRRHVRVMREAFAGMNTLLAYAMKANSNQAVLRVVAKEGAGADVVSGGELERAIAAGIPASKIVFSGSFLWCRNLDSGTQGATLKNPRERKRRRCIGRGHRESDTLSQIRRGNDRTDRC